MKRFWDCRFGSKFRAPLRLAVIGCYSAGVYLSDGKGVCLLHAEEYGAIRFGVALADRAPLTLPECREGRIWEYDGRALVCGDVVLRRGLPPRAELPRCGALRLTALEEAFARLGRGVFADIAKGSGERSPLRERTETLVCALEAGLRENDAAKIFRAARGLVGLGRGLTPDGDDFLTGLLYGFRERRLPACFGALADAVRTAEHETSSISAEYLECAATGGEFTALTDALRLPADAVCAERLVGAGHSSGSGMAAGALEAMKLLREGIV